MNKFGFLILIFACLQTGFSQESIVDVDSTRLLAIPSFVVKNNTLKVISDSRFEEVGLEIAEIGFRKNSHTLKRELLVSFKSETGIEMTVGAVLFGADRENYWQSSYSGLRQPLQSNLFQIAFPLDTIVLQTNSVLTLWAKEPIIIKPYQMWEWMDMPQSEWLVPEKMTDIVEQKETISVADSKLVYNETEVDVKPEFPGGETAKFQFLAGSIKYPNEARDGSVQGMTVVEFIVNTDGTLGEFNLVKDIGHGCGQESVRVLKTMPRWTPGVKDGKAVPVKIVMPFKFKL